MKEIFPFHIQNQQMENIIKRRIISVKDTTAGITSQTDYAIIYSSMTADGKIRYKTLNQSKSIAGNEYQFKKLDQDTISSDEKKYNYCVSSGGIERDYILRTMILYNEKISSFFMSDTSSGRDSFDVLLMGKNGKLYNLEIKMRSCSSKSFIRDGDFLTKKKYDDLIYDSQVIGSIPLYCCVFADNVMRVYFVNEIPENIPFKLETVWDHPGSKKEKKVLMCKLKCDNSVEFKIERENYERG